MIGQFVMFLINLTILFLGLWFVRRRLEFKAVNKEILNKVKKEINSLIVSLNQTTYDNISIIEEKVAMLKSCVRDSDNDLKRLVESLKEISMEIEDKKESITHIFDEYIPDKTYNPKKIVNQKRKSSEILNEPVLITGAEDREYENEEKVSIPQQVFAMYNSGNTIEEIKKKTGLSSGELELLINMNSITRG